MLFPPVLVQNKRTFLLPETPLTPLPSPPSHQAVPGGAAQRRRAQRRRTAGHLHRQRGKRRDLCLQSHRRQHRPPGGIRVRRPITGGRNAPPPGRSQRLAGVRSRLMFKVADLVSSKAPSSRCQLVSFIPPRRAHSLPLSRLPVFERRLKRGRSKSTFHETAA